MPTGASRARRRRSPPRKTVRPKSRTVSTRARGAAGGTRAPDRLARTLDTPALVRVVPHLAPETLHALIRHRGLDASGELVSAATPEQLTAVFDLDLWRQPQSGRDERFDEERFGEWLEALVLAGDVVAARIIAGIDPQLVITGLARYLRVFDPAALAMPNGEDEAIDVSPFSGLSCELGGYVLRAKRTDAWDAIVTMLAALQEQHAERFHAVMRACRRLSNSTPEIDGLDDLLMEPRQVLHDAAAERDHRRSQHGYVTPADARAFLQMARRRPRRDGPSSPVNPIVAAYFRAADEGAETVEGKEPRPTATVENLTAEDRDSIEAVVALLEDAGLLAGRPRALLTGAADDAARPARMEALLQHLGETDEQGLAQCSRELAYLANVLMAGSSVLSRAFTPREASDAAVAICNLGLEHPPTPDSLVVRPDLVAAFEAGWRVLHELGIFVATQLAGALANLQCVDTGIQEDLAALRRELTRECESRTPWRARAALDVMAMIDMPVCVGLQALLDECPVLPDAVTAILERRAGAIDPTAFQFICTGRQVRQVREFALTLLDVLSR